MRTPGRVPESRARGVVDTSVVIDLEHVDRATLPEELAISTGPKARGRRALDLLVAAAALAGNLPLYTSNPDDFKDLADLLEVHTVDSAGE